MSVSTVQRLRDIFDSLEANEISVYGGEPFLDIDLFEYIFRLFYSDDIPFFISSNGTFLLDDKSREYVFGILREFQYNDILTQIRVSNSIYHKQMHTTEMQEALSELSYCLKDTDNYYDSKWYAEDTDNPFFHKDNFYTTIYIQDISDTAEMNPSGRAILNCPKSGKSAHCLISTKDIYNYDGGRLDINIKPDGQISVCCTCDGCTVGNIHESDISLELIVSRIEDIRKAIRKELSLSENEDVAEIKMIDICPICIKHNDDWRIL